MPLFDHIFDTCFAPDAHQYQQSFIPENPTQDMFHAEKHEGADILCTASVGLTKGDYTNQEAMWEGVIHHPKDLIEGLKIGWSHPPEDIKVSVSKDGYSWQDVTNWLPATRPDAEDDNIVVQNVIFRLPTKASKVRLHMRDKRKEGMFGIKQIALVGHTLLS